MKHERQKTIVWITWGVKAAQLSVYFHQATDSSLCYTTISDISFLVESIWVAHPFGSYNTTLVDLLYIFLFPRYLSLGAIHSNKLIMQ